MKAIDSHYDAVIIGSGFGGSINALRLAEAGKSVLVLERGKQYQAGEFPRDVTDTEKLFWRYPKKKQSQGLYKLDFFSGIGVVTASGVGGGSLVYANIHIRPDPSVFEDQKWPVPINRQYLEPYYDKVASMLGISPVPAEFKMPKRDIYRDAAEKTGHHIFDPDQAVTWKAPGNPEFGVCKKVAECEFGCQYGAKHTMDLTYLAKAQQLGAQVQSGINITHISKDEKGYRVHYINLSNDHKGSVTGTKVVLSAGTLGTNKILFESRDSVKTLPGISSKLGYGFSGNGDFLGSIQNSQHKLEPWNGPDVTSVIHYFDDKPGFTMAAPTFNQPVMAFLASLGQGKGWLPEFLAARIWRKLDSALYWAFSKGFMSKPSRFPGPNAGDPERMTNLFAIGQDNANGRILLEGNDIDIKWNYAKENKVLIKKMTLAMEEIAEVYGGTVSPLQSWHVFKRILTVHPLGGCNLSDTAETGVVSPQGEVHGYPGLFVADGSVIPTSIGFHPVMTISAVSEHIAEAVVNSYTN